MSAVIQHEWTKHKNRISANGMVVASGFVEMCLLWLEDKELSVLLVNKAED